MDYTFTLRDFTAESKRDIWDSLPINYLESMEGEKKKVFRGERTPWDCCYRKQQWRCSSGANSIHDNWETFSSLQKECSRTVHGYVGDFIYFTV
jgi:hypothetical protein